MPLHFYSRIWATCSGMSREHSLFTVIPPVMTNQLWTASCRVGGQFAKTMFRALSWTQVVSRPVVSMTQRLHKIFRINYPPCLSAPNNLQPYNLLQIFWVVSSTRASSHIFFEADTAGMVSCCVPLFTVGCGLFMWYINKLVEFLYFKTTSHTLRLMSVVFQFIVFPRRTSFWPLHACFCFVLFFLSRFSGCFDCFEAVWCRCGRRDSL